MHTENSRKASFGLRVILPGLLVAQFIGTLLVFKADKHLYNVLVAVSGAGFQPVPNQLVMPTLLQWGPAIWGGLFFTLSLGGGLCLACLALTWLWASPGRRSRLLLALFLLFWVLLIGLVNQQGFLPLITLYCVLVPLVVSVATLQWLAGLRNPGLSASAKLHLVAVFVLAVCCYGLVDRAKLVEIRDYLLMVNPVGQQINDFYYRYTLYPAEILKSLENKQIKVVGLSLEDAGQRDQVAALALAHGFLPLENLLEPDLLIREESGMLVLADHRGAVLVRVPYGDFVAHSGELLRDFAKQGDRSVFLRRLIGFFLFSGSPLLLYILVHGALRLVFLFFLPASKASLATTLLCLAASFLFLGWIVHEPDSAMDPGDWRARVAFLKNFERQAGKMPVSFSGTEQLGSPHIAERYWLARTLGRIRGPKAYANLVTLLDDPQPNVAAMAFYGLGVLGERRAIPEILSRFKGLDHWYVQWYAHRALRSLGWQQRRGGSRLGE